VLKEGISKEDISAKFFVFKAACLVKIEWPSEGDLARDGNDWRLGEEWDR
jgi:hypothetical protein